MKWKAEILALLIFIPGLIFITVVNIPNDSLTRAAQQQTRMAQKERLEASKQFRDNTVEDIEKLMKKKYDISITPAQASRLNCSAATANFPSICYHTELKTANEKGSQVPKQKFGTIGIESDSYTLEVVADTLELDIKRN